MIRVTGAGTSRYVEVMTARRRRSAIIPPMTITAPAPGPGIIVSFQSSVELT
jgi:hypothetical protein